MDEQKIRNSLASTIKAEMARQGLTQTKLGKKIGMSQDGVSRLLKHPENIRTYQLIQICRALHCNIKLVVADNEIM